MDAVGAGDQRRIAAILAAGPSLPSGPRGPRGQIRDAWSLAIQFPAAPPPPRPSAPLRTARASSSHRSHPRERNPPRRSAIAAEVEPSRGQPTPVSFSPFLLLSQLRRSVLMLIGPAD